MRLSKIKLSGFKSFVDPTTLSFPSNLMGIVGPNGCGKSNIIDAIRWVLGESSAKTLRGDSMADVIFNGSSGRKPVGQASIELVFDNSDGQITGSYAGYSEVAMRRVVERDGTSQYYLNNSRCRRKDITNLLLGTGVGSHGYSIIEQGMISRLVEAKPEELRAFLEEAAGISKYKERRRETEHRIRHTRDNLERLQDLRDELEKQLGHLQRQANAAERYKVLKAEERRTDAELLLLRLNALSENLAEEKKALAARQDELDAAITRQGAIDTEIEKLRILLGERGDEFSEVQGVYYKVGADIARLEQAIQHKQADIQRQGKELEQAEAQLEKVSGHISDDEVELEKLDEMLGRLSPELEQAQAQLQLTENALRAAERNAEATRDRVEAATAAISAAEGVIQVEKARLEHFQQRLARIASEQSDKRFELEALDREQLDREIDELTAAEENQRASFEAAARSLEALPDEMRRLRREELRLSDSLDSQRANLQRDKGRLSSLEALQEAALGNISESAVRWLEQDPHGSSSRLADSLSVEPGWERAVEVTLSGYMSAIQTNTLESVAEALVALSDSGLAFVEGNSSVGEHRFSNPSLSPLASKVLQPAAAQDLLQAVYCAETLSEAMASRNGLRSGESIVTREGITVTRGSLRTCIGDDPQVGVIARGEEIEHLIASVLELTAQTESAATELAEIRGRIGVVEQSQSAGQAESQEIQRAHAETRAQLETRRTRRDDLRQRIDSLASEISALQDERLSIESAMLEARNKIADATSERAMQSELQEQLKSLRASAGIDLTTARERAEQERDRVKEIAILVESRRSSKQSASAALERVQAQRRYLVERRQELTDRIRELQAPLATDREALEAQLDERLKVEDALAQARSSMEACEQEVRNAEGRRSQAQQDANEARDRTESARMAAREVEVRAETVRERFVQTGFEQETLAAELPVDATSAGWTEKLESIGRKIQRLGAINLAAIEEFDEKSKRKEYLDRQFADLTEALATLEAAIRKIDGETRARFRETFNRANEGLSELFPRLFGGGHAYLELESDDLLSAGVTVMARPPGKRISTIHLMSGGEKALTAVALVFAIFKLNPAPFCLLDEVDAPLDDANVGRFSEIVREMSDRVQFVLITHNKTTMEAMNQLAGVTMHEPGVSRLVAVDIDEAVKLAAM